MPFTSLTPDTHPDLTAHTAAGTSTDADPRTARVAAFFETLSPASLGTLSTVYAEQARFKDPFNDVTGLLFLKSPTLYPELSRRFSHALRIDSGSLFLTHTTFSRPLTIIMWLANGG